MRTQISVQGTQQGTQGQRLFTVNITPHRPGAGDLAASHGCVVNFTCDLWPLLTYKARTVDIPSVPLLGCRLEAKWLFGKRRVTCDAPRPVGWSAG